MKTYKYIVQEIYQTILNIRNKAEPKMESGTMPAKDFSLLMDSLANVMYELKELNAHLEKK